MATELNAQQKRNKFKLEFLDLLTGAMFPLVIMLLFSCTIIMFAASDDLAVALVAVIGGDILLAGAYVIFGTKNGATAYRMFYLNETKRALNNTEEKVIFKTGEYALWKGFAIPALACVPYIVVQLINICAPNMVCTFLLEYAFGWAYYPFKLAGLPEALNFIFIIFPMAAHAVGYVYGKEKQKKIQAEEAAESEKPKKGRRKK